MTAVAQDNLQQALRQIEDARGFYADLLDREPIWKIQPNTHGQLQALQSRHTYRILIPGNGYGKTVCMAMDAEFLLQGTDPFKPDLIPKDRPRIAVWFCQKFTQFEIQRCDIEKVMTRGWVWSGRHNLYRWPNGSQLFLISNDSDWRSIQGIHIDAVYNDEHPDQKFWTEMLYRRRGEHKTRYMVAATMTQGITWFVKRVIQPWEDYCRRLGLTNDEALEQQPHPTTFMWNKGGIQDNPSMNAQDIEHYDSIVLANEKEALVRRQGGYADFTGEAVFSLKALERMRSGVVEGESGAFEFLPDSDPNLAGRLALRRSNRAHPYYGAIDPRYFRWIPHAVIPGGRITLFEAPNPEEAGNYVAGADFAAGLEDKDFDALEIGLRAPDGTVRQVAEAVGHWGDIAFAEIIFTLCTVYFGAFFCGERQFGLPTMRRLYDEMGYTYQFCQRRDDTRARRPSDLLGHHRHEGDTIIPNHSAAIARGVLVIRSADALEQHRRYQYQPRVASRLMEDVKQSSELKTGAPKGEFDDIVMAMAYMLHAAREVRRFPREKPAYKPGTYGSTLDTHKVLHPTPARYDPYRKR